MFYIFQSEGQGLCVSQSSAAGTATEKKKKGFIDGNVGAGGIYAPAALSSSCMRVL